MYYAFSVCVYSRWLSKSEMVFNGEWIDRLGRITHSRRRRLAQSYRCLYEQKTPVCADKLLSVHRATEFNIVGWKCFFWGTYAFIVSKRGYHDSSRRLFVAVCTNLDIFAIGDARNCNWNCGDKKLSILYTFFARWGKIINHRNKSCVK